jgi:hypothetical protein
MAGNRLRRFREELLSLPAPPLSLLLRLRFDGWL